MFFEEFPRLRGKRILLFLGRLHDKKGCDMLIPAFGKMAAESKEAFHLVMAWARCADMRRMSANCTGWLARIARLSRFHSPGCSRAI